MATILSVDFTSKYNKQNLDFTDVRRATKPRRALTQDIVSPAKETVCDELANEHAAEPIKDVDDIYRISTYLIANERYRDNMLFIVGINFGLRVSDLLQLRFSNLINDDLTFKTTFPVLEKKTKNTRKVRRNRYISINEAV